MRLGATALVVLTAIGLAGTAKAGWFSRATPEDGHAPSNVTYGVEENSQTLTLLHAAWNIDPDASRGGGEVSTVGGVALVAEATPFASDTEDQTMPATSDQIFLYMVQDGDTLSQIATMFNVSMSTIVWSNQLSSSKDIHPGQTLLILPISGIQHTVVKGDTVASIAKKYDGDADEIVTYNGLDTTGQLAVGSVITIPGGEAPVVAPVKKSQSSSGTTEPIHPTKVVANTTARSGYFINPLPGSVKTQGIHGYNAVDLAAPVGTPIRAAAAGKVIVSRVGGWNGGYGNYVVIDHPNGTQTLYAHQSKVIVWEGQNVVQGQIIGYVGSTGRSTGPHLHVEVRGGANPF
jgi:LysM repeat protein